MPAFTARVNFYLPGGGSLNIGGDDEVADIDRINQNLQKIDEFLGIPDAVSFPADPFPGQAVTINGNSFRWRDDAGRWDQLTVPVGKTAPANPEEGWLWVDTN